MHAARVADVLVGTHGAGLTNAFFMLIASLIILIASLIRMIASLIMLIASLIRYGARVLWARPRSC